MRSTGSTRSITPAASSAATQALGQTLNVFDAESGSEIDSAFAGMARRKVSTVLIGTDPGYGLVFRDRIISLAAQYGLPAMYDSRDFVAAGGLASYGSVLTDTWRQAGIYVGRVLKGEKPGDLTLAGGAIVIGAAAVNVWLDSRPAAR
mgnify:CR=1 FL=1